MSSSNKNWPSLFKSKSSHNHNHNHNHNHHHHEIDTSSYMHYSNDCVPNPKPRWNPKPEQIRILESIFNSGIVNPPRDEIQRIRIRLQEYGQIGDANVFYWFQNRKSRAKHKLRLLQKNRKFSNKDKIISPNNDIDPCFGSVNQETGLFPGHNNQLVITEPVDFQFPVQNDLIAAQSGFGLGEPVVTGVNNGVNLEMDKITEVNSNGYGKWHSSSIPIPVTVPLTTSQSQEGEVTFSRGEFAENSFSPVRLNVFINDMPFEVVAGLFNVREAFGNGAVLINSFGQPIPTDEFGVTFQPLQNGAIYYLI